MSENQKENPVSNFFAGAKAIAEGLGTVAKQASRDPVSTSYPDEMPALYPTSRHRLALNVNPLTGEHLCIACKQCERVCPDQCITVIPDPTAKGKVEEFYIDQGLCMFCGLCTEVCPTDCIINTNDFEMSDYTREALVYDIKKLTLKREESEFYFKYKELSLPKSKKAPATPVTKK
ncbi:MAG: NADH-quinone oxidoreductase subunit I [Candidatus Caenarcaniphilales bacterium]|nr:NADH-quinone oxidoreductase subunit I [Candidatus Caenarcaniphilales bacterium]